MIKSYNVKKYIYDDFTQYIFYPESILYAYDEIQNKEKVIKENKKYTKEQQEKYKEDYTIKNLNRTKDKIYKYAMANNKDWEYFLTLTFDPKKVNRYSYDDCVKSMNKFFDLIKHQNKNMKYIAVPERHKDGAYHFHALIGNAENLKIIATDKYAFGKYVFTKDKLPSDLVDKATRIYSIKNYKYGYSDISKIKDTKRVSTYITKYITKDLCLNTEGKKRYWSTRNLRLPLEQNINLSESEKLELLKNNNILFEKNQDIKLLDETKTIKYVILDNKG